MKYEIVSKEMLSAAVCRMKIEAPLLASAARPGQFLIVRPDEKGERIPLTISDFDPSEGTVTIVTQQIGASTAEILSKQEGDCFASVSGPLGLPSDFVGMDPESLKGRKYVFIAGGLGTAPVYPQARYLHERGAKVDVIIGAKNSGLLIYKEDMAKVCDNLYICTDDGSEGFHGLVTARLEKLCNEEGRSYDQAVAIGPMIMMKFATLTARKLNIPITEERCALPAWKALSLTAMKWISTRLCAARASIARRKPKRWRISITNAKSGGVNNGK